MEFIRHLCSFAVLRLLIPGFFGLTGIVLSAYAHHGMKNKLPEKGVISVATGVEYHMKHTLALLAIAALVAVLTDHPRQQACLKAAFGLITAGVLGFSFTIYLRAIVGESVNWTGFMTPLGGLFLMAGWAAVMVAPLL